jgi:lactoylglutathione lyase
MPVTKLLHTRMRVSNIDQTIQFYTDVLGLEVMERKTSPRGSHLQEDLVHLAFQVENLDETMRELTVKGVKITDGPTQTSSGSRFIFIDAPDGYEIELIERPPGTAFA